MKYILLMAFMALALASQAQRAPFFYVVAGDTIGVVFTVSQAQRIDRDLDLLAVLTVKNGVCDSANVALLSAIDDANHLVFLQEVQIRELKQAGKEQTTLVDVLNEKIAALEQESEIRVKQLELRRKQIAEVEKRNRSLKIQKPLFMALGGAAGIGIGILVGLLVN